MKTIRQVRPTDLAIILLGITLAIALRYSVLGFKSADYFDYTKIWYNTIKSEGFAAFSQDFSNYNFPYLYLLYLIARFLPDVQGLIAVKLPSLVADFITAWFAYRIVRLKHTDSPFPMFAAFAVLFAPTVILNSAFWGQADALYTSVLIGCIYFLLNRKHALAMLFWGISLSFKAQAVFIAPLLFGLFLRKEVPWKYFLLAPLMIFLAIIPAWMAGRPLLDLLLIYPSQAEQYAQLSMHAPSLLSWIPDSGRFFPYFYPFGLIMAIAAGSFFAIFIYRSQAKITPSIFLELALISVVLMPFLLPKMHERYFYPADVISIIFAFFFPRLFFVPIVMSVVSFFAYQPTLFGAEPVPISLLALAVLVLLIILIRDITIQLFLSQSETDFSRTQ